MPPALDPSVLDSLRQLNQDGEPDVVKDVLSLFIADAPMRLQAIASAAAAGDAAALQRAAHTLKGAAGTIGALGLQAACRDVEQGAKAGDISVGRKSVGAVLAEFERVKAEIDQLL